MFNIKRYLGVQLETDDTEANLKVSNEGNFVSDDIQSLKHAASERDSFSVWSTY